jgi:protein TonB
MWQAYLIIKRNAMLTNNILTSDLIDIIFDGRNKDYGAYELRKTYSKRIGRAMLVTGLVVFLTIGGVVLANSRKGNSGGGPNKNEIMITQIQEQVPEKLPEPEKPKPIEKPVVKEVAFLEPKIVQVVTEPPPSTDDLKNAKTSDKNVDGVDPNTVPDPGPQPPDNTGIIDTKPEKENDREDFIPIEIAAKFSGNWTQFLERNLDAEIPVNNGAPAGRYQVIIKFTIDENGHIISTDALTNYGYGLEAEAIRVIKKASSKWEAPIQNGMKLKATMKQMITFIVPEEG